MKHIMCCLLLVLGTATAATACDACGCSSGNQSLGILPDMYRHFAGLQYQYRSFNSEVTDLSEKTTTRSAESYNTYQVWGRYYVTKRLQLFAFIPYHQNMQVENNVTTLTSGIGDVSVLANFTLLKTDDSVETGIRHLLTVGGGVKAPTGHHDGISILDREGLPNMQPGTGSWDIVTDVNYTLRYQKLGCNVEAAYTFTTVDKEMYKYGNHLNAGLLGFYWIQKGDFSFLPQAGVRYDYMLHDYDNYDRKWLNEQTGGYQLFGVAGVQAYYKQFGLQVNYQLPVSQHYAGGNVTAKQYITTGLFFLF